MVTKTKMPPTQAAIAMSDLLGRRVTADACVEQRRDDEGDGAERLHDDQRRERQRAELADDRDAEHERADDPGRPRQQSPELLASEAGCAVRAAEALDLGHAAVLVLGAERHEDGAEQGQRDADQQAGVLEGADELSLTSCNSGRRPTSPLDTSRRSAR